jgi:hypothetical protein
MWIQGCADQKLLEFSERAVVAANALFAIVFACVIAHAFKRTREHVFHLCPFA